MSFFREIVSVKTLHLAVLAWGKNAALIENLIAAGDRRMLAVLREADVADGLANSILQMPKLLTFHLLRAWSGESEQAISNPVSASITRAAQDLVTYADGAVSVLAGRLLNTISSV